MSINDVKIVEYFYFFLFFASIKNNYGSQNTKGLIQVNAVADIDDFIGTENCFQQVGSRCCGHAW